MNEKHFFGVIVDGTSNPLLFRVFFFLYVILNILVLPLPVELGLFNPSIHPLFLIAALTLGRGVDAFLIYEIGDFIRNKTSTLGFQVLWLRKIITSLEQFIQHYGYYALFFLMSIPLMLDSIILYLFSLLNKERIDRLLLPDIGLSQSLSQQASYVRSSSFLSLSL